MKNNIKMAGFIGVPVALIGLTVAGVAFAAPKAPAEVTAPPQTVSVVAPSHTDADVESNDDASGPQEAPGTEQAD